jgi:hypothetical protein
MTRVAPALRTAASAACIIYRTGNFVGGTWTGFNFPFDISVVGTDNSISLETGILRRSRSFDNPGVICFSFTSGTVTVKNPAGRTVFTHSLRDGLILRKGTVEVEISTSLVPNPVVGSGSVGFFSFSPFGETADIEFGCAVVRIVRTPEPGYARATWNRSGLSRWMAPARYPRGGNNARTRMHADSRRQGAGQ